jgi:hypothetical protein
MALLSLFSSSSYTKLSAQTGSADFERPFQVRIDTL